MGPQPLSCGNPPEPRLGPQHRPASMGPQPLSCGNQALQGLEEPVGIASMGPQPLSCGNLLAPNEHRLLEQYASMGPQPLSCGNAVSAPAVVFRKVASMGPQPLSCGNDDVLTTFPSVGGASMGPQPLSCGNASVFCAHDRYTVSLQWGRSLSAAEIDLTETSVLLHILTHDASALLSARNHFHIEHVTPPPFLNSCLQIM